MQTWPGAKRLSLTRRRSTFRPLLLAAARCLASALAALLQYNKLIWTHKLRRRKSRDYHVG